MRPCAWPNPLREAVRNFRFSWEERVFRLGASIGVVPITADNEDVASIISAADSACAAAKEQGRNRVHSFAENDIELMRRRREMQWAARINAALEEGRFELFRMPILPLQKPETGAHYELLLRMRDENGRIVAPDNFIAAAERYGITPSIDRWVVENALRWLVSEADERERLAMCSINLSGQSLGDDKFLPYVIDQFHKSGLDASKICFEITETAAVASFSQANRFIQALKQLGCKFALDDFGTGLSSFGYLKHFPVDYLKIDGSFVREILHDPIDREMVRSINEIGHLTGKQTIAEFAENAEIIQMLQQYRRRFRARLRRCPAPARAQGHHQRRQYRGKLGAAALLTAGLLTPARRTAAAAAARPATPRPRRRPPRRRRRGSPAVPGSGTTARNSQRPSARCNASTTR